MSPLVTKKDPDIHELRKYAEALAQSRQTLTLATAEASAAWAAPVYYLFQPWRFYFFSNPQSRHIREAQAAGQAGGSVYRKGEGWQSIQGLQMSGAVTPVVRKREAARILMKYFKKYPFINEFFKTEMGLPNVKLFRQQFKVELYAYIPDKVLYIDNRIRFGFKGEIQLPDSVG